MLNPIASEAIFSATYVDNYIDSVENLPDDVQRQLSRIRDIDVQYRSHLRDVDHYYDLWKTLQNSGDTSANRRTRAIARMQQSLIQAQELGDEKMQIVNQLQELIDHKTRQLDSDQKNLDIKQDQQQDEVQCAPTPQKLQRTQSPARENLVANGAVSSDVSMGKEQHTYGIYSGNTVGCSNGSSTPTSDRSGHVSNGNVTQLTLSCSASVVHATGNNSSLTITDSQRSAGKRSRRRNETASHSELCGNESNSANEAGSIGGGVGVDKSSIGCGSASSQKQSTQNSVNSATQKKNSVVGQGGSGTSSAAGAAAGGVGIGSGASTGGGSNSGKKKKRKARGSQVSNAQNTREETPPPDPIDPDEPTYCLCDQISFGEMILCDNDLCPIEWFHFSCVSLVLKPKGKWYCPNCRGDRPNVMKPKAQFLKELERYNKEKEEKT